MIAALQYLSGELVRITPFPDTSEAKLHLRWLRSHHPDRFDRVRFKRFRTTGELDALRDQHRLISR